MDKNILNGDIEELRYRTWIEVNLTTIGQTYVERFGIPEGMPNIFPLPEFHNYLIGEAIHHFRVLDPELFRAVLVDHIVTTSYELRQTQVSKAFWHDYFVNLETKFGEH